MVELLDELEFLMVGGEIFERLFERLPIRTRFA